MTNGPSSNETPAFIELKTTTNKIKLRKKEEKENHVALWKKSGKSMRSYCEGTGIALSSFSQWVNQKPLPKKEAKAGPVQISALSTPIEIVLSSGLRVRLTKVLMPELLRLIKGLETCS